MRNTFDVSVHNAMQDNYCLTYIHANHFKHTSNDLEEGGGSPTMTGLLGSRLLFIQQNTVADLEI